MAASVLHAGPMVQMIFARRKEALAEEGSVIDAGLLILNLSPQLSLRFTISFAEI
jgi:hypothetical protein